MAATDLPAHLQRHPTRAAVDRLAVRLGLPNEPGMQDWEWEVADAERLDEFFALYGDPELSEDDRFTLMETIIQSCENLGDALDEDRRWAEVRTLLEKNIDLHISSVWYWAALDTTLDDAWRVSPFMRGLVDKHRRRFVAG
jgi:hypothetical protein